MPKTKVILIPDDRVHTDVAVEHFQEKINGICKGKKIISCSISMVDIGHRKNLTMASVVVETEETEEKK